MGTAAQTNERPNQSHRRSTAQTRPAPLTTREAHHSTTPKLQLKRELQCYMLGLIVTDCRLALADRTKINRKPGRLEIIVSRRKQTPATQINRQQIATSTITNRQPSVTNHESQITSHESRVAAALLDTNGRFHRNNNSRNSFKTNDRVNPYSIQTQTFLATKCITSHAAPRATNHESQVTNHSRSNRHTARLENAICHRKQTTALSSNRHFFQVLRISSAASNLLLPTANGPIVASAACFCNNADAASIGIPSEQRDRGICFSVSPRES